MLVCLQLLNKTIHNQSRVYIHEMSHALTQKFIIAEPNSVWQKIFQNHMDEGSFLSETSGGPINTVSQRDGSFTVFSYLHDVPPCTFKSTDFHKI